MRATPIQSRMYKSAIILFFSIIFSTSLIFSAEVPEGTVISAENLDSMKLQTFEGKTIGSMLNDKIEMMIRDHNMKIWLRHSEEVPIDPRWIEATKKYSGDVKYDPVTHKVSGYKAGLAFPSIDLNDPQAGFKLNWNMYLKGGFPDPDVDYTARFDFIQIDFNKGVENTQKWVMLRGYDTGCLMGEPDKGTGVFVKQITLGLEPYDIRGIGTFSIRYMDGRVDDAWAYVRSVRRTRRTGGGSWMDPTGGTDVHNDEHPLHSGYPGWYPSIKFLEKRWVLAVAHSKDWGAVGETYPIYDLKTKPYWTPVNTWEPREVYVIEVTMPDEHHYGKKIVTFDAKTLVGYFNEAYDKRGDFNLMLINFCIPVKGVDSPTSFGHGQPSGLAVNFKTNHATMWTRSNRCIRNPDPSKFNSNDVSLQTMEQIAKGTWRDKIGDLGK